METASSSQTTAPCEIPPHLIAAEGLSSRSIVLDGAQQAPREILIWKLGPVPTLKGVFLYTQKSAALIKAQWQMLGRDIGFDYGHEAFKPGMPEKDRIAAGWGKVDIRADGSFWISQIQWTPEAAQKVANRELRYHSPAFDADSATGEILNAKNVALTNFPATLNARPILLADGDGPQLEGVALGLHLLDLGRAILADAQEQSLPAVARVDDAQPVGPVTLAGPAIPTTPGAAAPLIDSQVDAPKKRATLTAATAGPVPFHAYPTHVDETWDADAAVSELRKWAGVEDEDPPADAWQKYAQGFAYVAGEGDKLGDFSLPHHRVIDGALVTSLKGTEAAGAAMQGARGGVDIPESDRAAVREHLAKHYHQFDRRAPWEEEAPTETAAPPSADVEAAYPAGVPSPSQLPSSRTTTSSTEQPPMADMTQMKQHAQALALARQCTRMMSVAQSAAESDDPALQAMAAPIAEQCAKMLGAYKAAFPGMGEPDGDEVVMSVADAKAKDEKMAALSAEVESLRGVVLLAETLTGKKGAELKGGLVLLSERAEQVAQQSVVNAEQQRLTLLDSMVKTVAEGGTQQILPTKRALFETFTLSELEAFKAAAPVVGPKPAQADQGARQLNGNAPPMDDAGQVVLSEQVGAEALQLLGIPPDSAWLKPGQGMGPAKASAL